MPRRTYNKCKNGQLYASEWVEWFVDCAVEGCREKAMVCELGDAYTIAEAEGMAKNSPELKGWKKIKGLYYCPQHTSDQ